MTQLEQLLTLANHYPSPHNGQPVRVKAIADDRLELYFQKERGLQAADISFIFSFVSMGVFVEHFQLAARALGHQLKINLELPKEVSLKGSGLVKFAEAHVSWAAVSPDTTLQTTLRNRQTSRKKYRSGLPLAAAQKLSDVADEADMQLRQLDDQQAQQAIWLNQRAVFDDMFDEATRRELNHWLRYSRRQKETLRDGLAYDCMELNGRVMKYIVNHPKILRVPIIAPMIKQYHLHTMRDKSSIFYMMAPFATETDAFRIGQVIMQQWLAVAEAGCYLHPFGTIMSNYAAHRDFLKLVGEHNESRAHSYLVFIFRSGHSAPPVRSLRLPISQHLILE